MKRDRLPPSPRSHQDLDFPPGRKQEVMHQELHSSTWLKRGCSGYLRKQSLGVAGQRLTQALRNTPRLPPSEAAQPVIRTVGPPQRCQENPYNSWAASEGFSQEAQLPPSGRNQDSWLQGRRGGDTQAHLS